jgi:hypothetical protein
MSKKKTTTKAKAPKATKTAKAATPAVQVKKDAKGRFWLVPKDGGQERGPFATKKEALDAKAGGDKDERTGYAPQSQLEHEEVKKLEAARAKQAKGKKVKEPKAKKVGALDAAAQVLAASKEPMNCKEMIEAMAKQALWTSPGGKTPHATLYSAIIREIALKGKESRFVKTERGKFAAKA